MLVSLLHPRVSLLPLGPLRKVSLLVQLVGPSFIAFLGTLMRFAGELVKFVATHFSPHL